MKKEHPVIPLSQAVETIKTAILQGQYEALKEVNRVQLAVYYAIGKYLSKNTRSLAYGSGGIKTISDQLRKEMPVLRGFSATQLKDMRRFYEAWEILDSNNTETSNEDSTVTTVESYCTQNQIDIIGIVLCKSANKDFVEFVIQDYDRPMGVATYSTAEEMPNRLRKALPDVEELRKIMRKGIDGK